MKGGDSGSNPIDHLEYHWSRTGGRSLFPVHNVKRYPYLYCKLFCTTTGGGGGGRGWASRKREFLFGECRVDLTKDLVEGGGTTGFHSFPLLHRGNNAKKIGTITLA